VTNGMPSFGFTAGVGDVPQGGPGLAPTGGLPPPNPDGSVDIAATDRASAANNRPFWSTRLQFYGPRTVVAAQWEYAKAKLLEIPGARATDGPSYDLPLQADQLANVLQVTFGVPNLSMFSIGARSERNPTPSNGHLWFSPIIPRTGEAILEAQKALWRIGREVGLPFNRWSMPTYWSRAFIFLVAVSITPNVETDRRNIAAFRRMVKLAGDQGYGEYRTHPLFQDDVMDVYSFSNHALRRFCEALKEGSIRTGSWRPAGAASGRSGIRGLAHDRLACPPGWRAGGRWCGGRCRAGRGAD
jgi:hypothetical protein